MTLLDWVADIVIDQQTQENVDLRAEVERLKEVGVDPSVAVVVVEVKTREEADRGLTTLDK